MSINNFEYFRDLLLSHGFESLDGPDLGWVFSYAFTRYNWFRHGDYVVGVGLSLRRDGVYVVYRPYDRVHVVVKCFHAIDERIRISGGISEKMAVFFTDEISGFEFVIEAINDYTMWGLCTSEAFVCLREAALSQEPANLPA